MKIKTNVVLKNMDGIGMKDVVEGKAIDATLKLAIVNGLLASTQKQDSGIEKVKKYELARKVYANDEVELDENEIKLIKDCVGAAFPSPLIVGQVFNLLKV